MQEQNILVKEYDTFEAAWEAAKISADGEPFAFNKD